MWPGCSRGPFSRPGSVTKAAPGTSVHEQRRPEDIGTAPPPLRAGGGGRPGTRAPGMACCLLPLPRDATVRDAVGRTSRDKKGQWSHSRTKFCDGRSRGNFVVNPRTLVSGAGTLGGGGGWHAGQSLTKKKKKTKKKERKDNCSVTPML